MPFPTQSPPPAPTSSLSPVPRTVEDESIRLSVSFRPLPRRVTDMRQLVARLLRRADLGEEVIGTVELLVSELLTNAVVHGRGEEIRFSLAHSDGGDILIEVDDHSPAHIGVGSPAPEDEGGRGLVLVDALARVWGRRGGCTWCAVSTRPVRV